MKSILSAGVLVLIVPRPLQPVRRHLRDRRSAAARRRSGGTKFHSAWAIQTSEGLIVIDALFDYAVKDSVVEGLRTLGLNPATMKYLIISHGHGDHHGGAKYLQDEFGPRVVMGGPDWDLVAKNSRDPASRRDMAATDGQKITLGDTTVTLYATPGHTAGTFSLVIPVKDGGRPHLLATWGGTAISRTTSAATVKAYVDSAVRYRGLLAKLGVEGMLCASLVTGIHFSRAPSP